MQTINILFSNLDRWRHLPNYQLERRADVFFALYLPFFLESMYRKRVRTVIPEFPLRVGTLYPNIRSNKSFKIDYLIRFKNDLTILFVELKTDGESRRDKQDKNLMRAKKVGMVPLLEGIEKIHLATSSKDKYSHLRSLLQRADLLDKSFNIIPREYDIRILYLQPEGIRGNKSVIGFGKFANFVNSFDNGLGKRFAKSLRKWAKNRAGVSA